MTRSSLSATLLLLPAAVLGAPTALAGTLLYQQSPVAGTGSAWTSSHPTGVSGYQSFDNFSLSTAADVGAVTWRGYYRDSFTPANNPAIPATTNWTIGFWSDAGGPSAALFSLTVPASSVTSTFAGYTTNSNNETLPLYDFRFVLPAAFHLNASTIYWFSPVEEHAPSPLTWGWTKSDTGDNATIQVLFDASGNRSGSDIARAGDRAFTLEAIPEPTSLCLLALGVAGLARRSRPDRHRQNSAVR